MFIAVTTAAERPHVYSVTTKPKIRAPEERHVPQQHMGLLTEPELELYCSYKHLVPTGPVSAWAASEDHHQK